MKNVISIKINNEQFESFKQIYKNNAIENNDVNALEIYKIKNSRVTIYKTLKTVIQGNDAEDVYQILFQKNYQNEDEENKSSDIIDLINKVAIYGCDEVGNGDTFGGIVFCCCKVKIDKENQLANLNVRDSKELDDEKMKIIFNQIKDLVEYKVFQLTAEEYNEFYKKYKNLNHIKAIGHNNCLKQFSHERKNNEYVILDQFMNENDYYNFFLEKLNEKPEHIDLFETNAESKYISVATASVIARVYFLREIDQIAKKLNLNFYPLGSSNPLINEEINKMKVNDIKKYTKINFKNVAKILAQKENKKTS